MIPKVIHYCWFGGQPLPESALKCIESWRRFCPDYEIKQWSEENYDVNKIQYIKEAYQEKKFAFVTDELLYNSLYLGMERSGRVNTGLGFGAEVNHPIVRDNLELYTDISFLDNSNVTCVTHTTNLLKKYGLKNNNKIQHLDNAVILPTEYLCPLSFETNRLKITENTYSIHHYDMSWKDKRDKFLRLKIQLRKWVGDDFYEKVIKRIGK